MAGKWPTFVQSGKDLEQAFDDAVGYFNARQAASLQNAFSPNVVLKKVGHPLPTDLVLGAANVMTYIQAGGLRITLSFIRTARQNMSTRCLDPSTASPNGTRRSAGTS